MTWEERVDAIAGHGFTDRQAGFLVTVMLHAGVCLGRQYCRAIGITSIEPLQPRTRVCPPRSVMAGRRNAWEAIARHVAETLRHAQKHRVLRNQGFVLAQRALGSSAKGLIVTSECRSPTSRYRPRSSVASFR